MAKRPPAGQCVHCLKFFDALTWDHVFPEAWYPSTTPANVAKWKVPSCSECNKNHGRNEADLLVSLGLCIAPDEHSAAGIADKVLRALSPNAGKNARDVAAREASRARIIKRALSGTNIPRQAIYPGFGPKPDMAEADQIAITVSARGLDRLTEKIVRGMTYIEEGKVIDDSYEINHFVLGEVDAREFCVFLDKYGTACDRHPGLSIRRAVIPGDRISAVFEIEIWGQLRRYATVMPRQLPEDT